MFRFFMASGGLLIATALSWAVHPGLSQADAKPSLATVPAISGPAQVGQRLTESHADWGFSPVGFAYQWEDCDAAGRNCAPIRGASGQSYLVSPSDLGHTLRVQETAFGWGEHAQATSGATAVVSNPPSPTPSAAVRRIPSTTTLMALEPAAVTNQTVTLIATVTSSSPAGQPSGTLTFANHGTPIAGCQNDPISPTGQSVTVSCRTSFAASASQLTAVFTPSATSVVAGSASPPYAFTVQPEATTTTLVVSRRTVRPHAGATYIATVQPSYLGPVEPSQSVAFLDNGQPVSACAGQPLVWTGTAATATCKVSQTGRGQHLITARYSGDASFAGSTSSPPELVDAVAGRIHPVLSWSFYYAPRYTKVRLLRVDHLPRGTRVRVTCAGRGCPLRSRAVSVRRSSPTYGAANLVQLFGTHRLRPGVVVAVSVQRRGWIGKLYSFKIRAAHSPRVRISCQAPGLPAGVGC